MVTWLCLWETSGHRRWGLWVVDAGKPTRAQLQLHGLLTCAQLQLGVLSHRGELARLELGGFGVAE